VFGQRDSDSDSSERSFVERVRRRHRRSRANRHSAVASRSSSYGSALKRRFENVENAVERLQSAALAHRQGTMVFDSDDYSSTSSEAEHHALVSLYKRLRARSA